MNQPSLEKFLREKFKIETDHPGHQSVRCLDNTFKNVTLELPIFTLGDFDFKIMFEAMTKGYCRGFFLTPRTERKSPARHFIVFH